MPESLSKQYKKRKSMKKEENNLDRLKGTNPFTVPEGYMEGLTERIMSQLPEKPEERAKRISLVVHGCGIRWSWFVFQGYRGNKRFRW